MMSLNFAINIIIFIVLVIRTIWIKKRGKDLLLYDYITNLFFSLWLTVLDLEKGLITNQQFLYLFVGLFVTYVGYAIVLDMNKLFKNKKTQ